MVRLLAHAEIMARTSRLKSVWTAAGRTGRRPIVQDTAFIITAQLWSKGALHVISMLMAQFLSVQAFSTYNVFLLTTTVLASYLGLGLPLAAAKLLARGDTTDGDRERLSVVLYLAAAATVGAVVLKPLYIPVLMPSAVSLNAWWVVAGGALSAWSVLGQSSLYAVRGFRRALLPILSGSALLALGAALAIARSDVHFLIVGALASPLVAAIGSARALSAYDTVPRPSLRLPSSEAFHDVLRTAVPGIGIGVIFTSMTWMIASSLLSHQSSAEQFNMFSVGMQWFALVLFIPLALGQAVFPRYIRMAHQQSTPARMIIQPVASTVAMLLVMAPFAALFTPLLILLYGNKYPFSPVFVVCVILAAAVAGAQTLLSHFVIASRGAGTWMAASLIALSICIACLHVAPPATALAAVLVVGIAYGSLLALAIPIAVYTARTGGRTTTPAAP
ncbi:hypothetical protein [Sphingomonas sp.]|uniref:hypothetical protein n=1 Tax=Sphingomonas sp. TaxID=28214 RepID=UPI0035BBAD1D